MYKKIGTWVIIGLLGLGIVANSVFKFTQRDPWWTYAIPLTLWASSALMMVFPSRSVLIQRVAMGLFFAVGIIPLVTGVWDNWRSLVANWPVVLMILYLPVMLLLWFGYQKWEQKRK